MTRFVEKFFQLTINPVSKGIKHSGTSIEVDGFKVPMVDDDIPHQAMVVFDSKLNNKSILLSLE